MEDHEFLNDLKNRVIALEEIVHDLPENVANLAGQVETLSKFLVQRLNGVQSSVERASSVRSAVTFASVVIVPIIVALIGGYFVLRASR